MLGLVLWLSQLTVADQQRKIHRVIRSPIHQFNGVFCAEICPRESVPSFREISLNPPVTVMKIFTV